MQILETKFSDLNSECNRKHPKDHLYTEHFQTFKNDPFVCSELQLHPNKNSLESREIPSSVYDLKAKVSVSSQRKRKLTS